MPWYNEFSTKFYYMEVFMKKRLLLGLFSFIICFTLTGCEEKTNLNKTEKEIITIKEYAELNEVEKVTMTIKGGTLTRTGATIIITDLNENSNTYGSEYQIDKKENGSWEKADIIFEGNYGWNSIGYTVDENNQLEMDINWKDLYGTLENGEYRIVKNVFLENIENGTIENSKKYFSVEFTIQ